MGKFRSKLKGQTKGKRWAKGHSSTSNPETKKYRDQAKSRFFQENLGPSGLTSDALRKHDAVQALAPTKPLRKVEEMEDDSASCMSSQSSFQTMKSFASEWSDCSNMSFNRFLKVFRSDSALHKEMLAILAAITEVIKQNGGTESPTEYFCLLVTTLEKLMSENQKNEDQITAVLSLFNMGIKTVPVPVLRVHFGNIAGKLLQVLNEYCNSDNNVIVKSTLGVLAVLLKNQELAVWNESHTQRLFVALLNPFCIHTKPKWRKAAQQAAVSVLAAEVFKSTEHSTAADRLGEFCLQTLQACLGSNNSGPLLVSSIQAGQTTILHLLGLLKDAIVYLAKSHIKSVCEIALRLMGLNYPIVTSCCLQVLHALFSSQKAVATTKLNAQIIGALYDYLPSVRDVQPTLAWLAVMQQAYVHLADIDLATSINALPRIFSTITHMWLSQNPQILKAATLSLEILLKDALAPVCAQAGLVKQYSEKIEKCFQHIQEGLSYQYHLAWHQVLHTISVMFEVGGLNCSHLLMSCLKSLSELRDSYKFNYNNEVEHAVGAAIRSMGAEKVLSVINLKKENGDLNLDRSWLLPVLKENIRNSTLEFWIRGILPLALYCQKRAVQLQESNDGIGAHSAELLHLQLWNLLPSFCNNPTDISTSFKSIAKILGTTISDRKDLRMACMACLRKLIASAKESENPADVSEITRFDKNYLPILFNFYTTEAIGSDEEGQRLAALDTVKIYLTIARPELTKQLFEHALERIAGITEPRELYVKESILDLIRALIPYQSVENIEKLYVQCIKTLPEIKQNKEQKKAYRLLEEICGSKADGCKEFLQKNRKAVQKILMKSLDSSTVSSKGARLRCLNYLLKSQPQLDHENKTIRSAIPEAVICCKDINQRCRAAAYELLNTIGEILQNREQMQQFVTMVLAGFAGPPQLISATILALASILHNFTGALGQANIQAILENVLNLMSVPTREIVDSCLSFVKVFSTSIPSPIVAAALPAIIKSFCAMTEDCKRQFRLKIRYLLDRLVRKYGCDSIMQHVPTSDTVMYKRLRNLRKLHSRNKRKKDKVERENEEADVDMEEDFMVKARPKSIEEILADSDSEIDEKEEKPKKSNKYNTYIEEDNDTIVDFNDPTAVSRISVSKPTRPTEVDKVKKNHRGFKTASDGRLIINDLSDSDDEGGKKKSKFDYGSDSDSDNDALSSAETEILRDKKRKRSTGSVVSGISTASTSKYKPGGSGIHRPVPASGNSARSEAGSEYKAKKAKGDIKKGGKLDPYAYLPLQRNALNKRKKVKRAGQFKNIIGAAKSGAKKGMKAKKNRN